MIIATTYDKGNIFPHFGKSEFFKIYEVAEGSIVSAEVVTPSARGHEGLSGFLNEAKVEAVICGGIGEPAINALHGHNITVYPGQSGDTDSLVQALLKGELKVDPNFAPHNCGHHHD